MATVRSRSEKTGPGRTMRGRERAWNSVMNLMRAEPAGRSPVLLIDGEAGTGKSLLLAKAAAAAAALGFSIATGGVREFADVAPFEPLLSALVGLAAVCDGGASGRPGRARPRSIEEIRSTLEGHGDEGPVWVSLDDLQRAGPATLTAIHTLTRQPTSRPVVWLLARCTTGRAVEADRLFDLLERDGATRLTLPPFDDTTVREVVIDTLGAVPDPDLLTLASEAGGNPALLIELLSGLRDEEAIRIADGHVRLVTPRIPVRIQSDIRHRLDRVDPATRHLLSVGAIIGRSFSPEDAAEVLGTTPAALLPRLDEAFSAGFLVATPDELAFRNGLVWRVVTDRMPAPIRRALHRQVGDLLMERGGSAVPAAASHLMQGVRGGDARALTGLDRAVTEVLPASPRAAAALAAHALRLTDSAEAAWPARTLAAVRALSTAGRLREALDLVDSALMTPLPGDTSVRLRCLRSAILRLTGRTAEAATEATTVLAVPGLSGELHDEAELALLNAQAGTGDDAGARERAERIMSAADGHGDALLTGALITLALADWDSGRLTDGLRLAREAVHHAKSADARGLHPRMTLAMLLIDVRRLEEARAVMASTGEEPETTGHLAWAAAPAVLRARLHLAAGRFDDAAAEAEAGLAITSELGPHVLTSTTLSVLATARLRAGDLNAAQGYVGGDRPSLCHCGSPYAEARLLLVRAQIMVAREGVAAAAETVGRLCDDLATHRWALISEPTAAPWLVRTALTLGDRARAERVAAAMDRLAGDHPVFASVGVTAVHARGLLDRDRSALARAAAEHADPWARASAAEDLGTLIAGEGPALRRDAVAGLDMALTAYTDLGAARDAARVRRRLRRLGIRRRHWSQADRPVSGWASLTDTERSVSELVAQGLTNRQVADQLFMSVHTVAFHLRHIFRKLEVASRVELARLTMEAAT
ncbi:LuxR C-terminal-related transcriptional regulator [Actinoallomurus purpureus]|uniref:helix-turn-helix transcriptional regulator n=1 Tax=Actinoallomurus purpureus TaxID=478114 RepID=UPI0020939380|nr:LuxR C-terminal-related transcriptional regulator [Actinoallomurus purpureus]MCO6010775.1 LuxR C-terminal-related transcriptional regulator [Actinoallomurus purpureus]